MSNDKKAESDFNAAADRRAYEKEHFPDDLKRRLIDIEENYGTKKTTLLERQKENYAEDVEKERKKISPDRPLPHLKPESQVNSKAEKEERKSKTNAERIVDERYEKARAALMEEREEQIEEIHALNRDRNPSVGVEENAMEAMRAQKKHDREITLYQGPERKDKNLEQDRER